MYRLTKNIYIYIYLILKNETYQSNVWSEFTCHPSLAKKRDDKLTQEEGGGGGGGAVIQWECSFWKS